jgi:hypothetical protein
VKDGQISERLLKAINFRKSRVMEREMREVAHIPGDKVLSNTWRASMVDGSLEEGDVGGEERKRKKGKS